MAIPPVDDFSKSDPSDLAKAFRLFEDGGHTWSDEDLRAILDHQLDAALDFQALVDSNSPLRSRIVEELRNRPKNIRTLRTLLASDQPPELLLNLAKEFMKLCGSDLDGLPREVSKVLYYMTIFTARSHGLSISKMDVDSLTRGAKWASQQGWLDDRTRDYFLSQLERL